MHSSKWLGIAICSVSAPLAAQENLHVDQADLNALIEAGNNQQAFDLAFEVGDELFEHSFSAAEGVGAKVGNGQRFTMVPRADLIDEGAWATHIPPRSTGPNSQSCETCHNLPFGDGAGDVSQNNVRDPYHSGNPGMFINRQPPHIFGIGALRLLAEEMTAELQALRDAAIANAKGSGNVIKVNLRSKGADFGSLTVLADGQLDLAKMKGIDADFVVKPIDWKGSTASVRAFVRDAGHNELGMQAVEMAGTDIDGDDDGVVNELGVGDITALAIYQAAQPRPVTKLELSELGLIDPLSPQDVTLIGQGEMVFTIIGCSSCHTPSMTVENTVFSEPSQIAIYRDQVFPSSEDPLAHGLSPATPVRFDITQDMPDNVIEMDDGSKLHLGNFQTDADGQAIVALYGDLRRHNMGSGLAESIAENGIGPSVFMTQELWGVASTPPYLHDGRATTLREAINLHGGEADTSRNAFQMAGEQDQNALIAFLNNLVLFKVPEED